MGWFPWAALGFVLAGTSYSMLLGEVLRFPDERDYLVYARHLVQSGHYSLDGLTPDAYRPPGYGIALAPFVAIFDSAHTVRVLQFTLLALSVWWLAGLALITPIDAGRGEVPIVISHDRLATLLLIGLTGYPVLIYTAGTLFPQTLLGALVVGGTAVLCHPAASHRPLASAASAGLIAGYAAQVSPTALMLVPVLGWYCLENRVRIAPPTGTAVSSPGGPAAWQIGGAFLLCAALVPGAWLARNLIVLEKPVLFSTNLAENLDNAVLSVDRLEPGEVRPPKSAIEYGAERLEQLIGSPQAYRDRLIEFFATRNELQVSEEASSLREQVMAITYLTLLALVAARLLQAAPIGRQVPLSRAERIAVVLYVLTALFHALVFTRIRYRLPFDLLLLLPAMNAVRILLQMAIRTRMRERRSNPGTVE